MNLPRAAPQDGLRRAEGWVGMLIECPRCGARYQVAEGLIGPAGKSVRCAKCGNVWLARGLAAPADDDAPLQWPEAPGRRARDARDAADAEPATAAAEAVEDPALAEFRAARDEVAKPGFARLPETARGEAPSRRGMAAAAVIGWVATVLFLGAAGWGGYAYRDAVMQAWPPSERVYLALGLRP
jgi:predicted Zn finger-like uncharacterized protein